MRTSCYDSRQFLHSARDCLAEKRRRYIAIVGKNFLGHYRSSSRIRFVWCEFWVSFVIWNWHSLALLNAPKFAFQYLSLGDRPEAMNLPDKPDLTQDYST